MPSYSYKRIVLLILILGFLFVCFVVILGKMAMMVMTVFFALSESLYYTESNSLQNQSWLCVTLQSPQSFLSKAFHLIKYTKRKLELSATWNSLEMQQGPEGEVVFVHLNLDCLYARVCSSFGDVPEQWLWNQPIFITEHQWKLCLTYLTQIPVQATTKDWNASSNLQMNWFSFLFIWNQK